MNLKIIHLNIEGSRHLDAVANLLDEQKPDVACFVEAMHKDVQQLATKLGYELAFAPLVIRKRSDTNENDQEGAVILSRVPILETKVHRYDGNPEIEVPIHFDEHIITKDKREKQRWHYHNSLLTVSIPVDNKIVTIATTHFPVTDHRLPGLADHDLYDLDGVDEVERARIYLDRLIQIIRTLETPLVFTSDLNNARGEYVYDALAHELVDVVPRDVISSIDPALHRQPELALMVDTIMTSSDVTVENFEALQGMSDHKAFVALCKF